MYSYKCYLEEGIIEGSIAATKDNNKANFALLMYIVSF